MIAIAVRAVPSTGPFWEARPTCRVCKRSPCLRAALAAQEAGLRESS